MNIFVLDTDPRRAAHYACDRHVVKMILEAAQLLSTVCHQHGKPAPMRATHPHHPCTKWAGASAANYRWLWEHLQGLLAEYTRRYGKHHMVEREHYPEQLWQNRPELPEIGLTPFAQAMPAEYKVPGDAVKAYRQYYVGEKCYFAKWKMGDTPQWYSEGLAGVAAEPESRKQGRSQPKPVRKTRTQAQ